MSNDTYEISYHIKTSTNRNEIFVFQIDNQSADSNSVAPDNPPAWTELSYRQCSHCPLSAETHKYCPVALQLYDITQRFEGTKSIDEVDVEVITEDRKVVQKTAIQRVIASMLELSYASSGCPKTEWLRPLARFHSPLASEEETVFRSASMYLLAQFFIHQTNKQGRIEFSGLNQIYEDMHTLNAAVASRLQHAIQSDSVKNAITLVDMYSTLIPILLDDQLAEMRGFFQAYLPIGEATTATTDYLKKAKAFSLELEPVTDQPVKKQDDNIPSWLKEVRPNIVSKPVQPVNLAVKPEKPSPFVTNSGLSLELAPLDFDLSGKSSSGKAKFILPDD